jgi:uncharacterized membrane protein YhaH (DUF805 family)
MKLFTAKGRASRKKYAVHLMWLILFIFIVICMGELFVPNRNEVFVLPFFLFFWIIDILVTIRRLHDLNRSGRQYWLLMIPIYNIYLSLILWFKRGTRGPNRYGPDPLHVNFFSQQTLTESELSRPIG